MTNNIFDDTTTGNYGLNESDNRRYNELIDDFGGCIFDGNDEGAIEAEAKLIAHFRWYEYLLDLAIDTIRRTYWDLDGSTDDILFPWDEVETEYLEGR